MKTNFSKGMVLLTVIIMDLLTGMEFDLFVPSFPELQDYFKLSPSWVASLLSVNFIGYCLSLFICADLSDRYGRKPIILFGLVTFVIGSVFCLWPPSFNFLLWGRLLQGIGVAAPAILSFLIITDSYPLKEQQFLMAMLNGSFNIAAGVAPVIGSYITLYFHWQGNFTVLLVLGISVLFMTIFFIPFDTSTHSPESISLRGWQGYVAILQSKPLLLLIVNLLFIFVPYWIFVGISPLLYMKDLNVSLAHFGYYQGILAFVFALGSLLFGLVIKNGVYEQKRMLYFSIGIFIVSMLLIGLAILFYSMNPLFITFAILIFTIGQIIPTTILYPLCLNFLPFAKGRVSAIILGVRFILTAIGLQIAGYFYQGSFQSVGVILIGFISIAVSTLFYVIQNRELMRH